MRIQGHLEKRQNQLSTIHLSMIQRVQSSRLLKRLKKKRQEIINNYKNEISICFNNVIEST